MKTIAVLSVFAALLYGCAGSSEAPDPDEALRLYRHAAQHGIKEGFAGIAHVLDATGDPEARIEAHAWRMVEDRLLDEGCYGLEGGSARSPGNPYSVRAADLSPYELDAAEQRGARYWEEYGSQARHTLGCD